MTRFRPTFAAHRLEDRAVPAANWYALGAGPGVPAVARLLDETGAERFAVSPFGDDFTGGLTVAVGDVTGDGVPDLVTGAGGGGGPRVAVFDGATGRPASGPHGSRFAFDESFTGGVNVAVADADRDGFAEVIAAAGDGGGPRVVVFDGKTGARTASFFAYDPAFRGGATVATADVGGDDRAEIVTGAGPGGGPHVKVFTPAGAETLGFFAYPDTFRGGVRVAAGDLTGDLAAEIVTGSGAGGGTDVGVFDGTTGTRTGGFRAGADADRRGADVGVRYRDGETGGLICTAVGGVVRDFDGRTFAPVEGGAAAGTTVGGTAARTGDAVLTANAALLQIIWRTTTPPPQAARALAMVNLAAFDAVAAVPAESAGSAAAVAAARVTAALFPTYADAVNGNLTSTLAVTAAGAAGAAGIAAGEAAAARVLAARRADGATAVVPYAVGSNPGDYQLTPPANRNPLAPQWGAVTPFALQSGGQFRPANPPALNSAEYAAAVNEVQSLGRADSIVRTADQTQIARFWADSPGSSPTPPGHWAEIAMRLSKERGLSISENARMFAQLGVAMADAAIAAWDVKFATNLWRPITAIRAAGTDGNPATTADAAWTPLLGTPNFPTYVSGHSTFSAAAAAVLGGMFGPNTAFTTSSAGLPGVVRSFPSFTAAAEEAGLSRIYGGIHFDFDNTAGQQLGRSIGEYVMANPPRPS